MFAKPRPDPTTTSPPAEASPRYIVTRQPDIASFFAVSLDTVKSWAKQGMPGRHAQYDLQAIVSWLRTRGPWRERALRNPQAAEDALLLSGPETPGLERLRTAKASLAELELQTRQGTLISVEAAKAIGLQWAVIQKRTAEQMAKRFGTEAAAYLAESLQECQRVLDAGFSRPVDAPPDHGLVAPSRQPKAGKAHKPVGRRRSHRPKRTPRR